MKMTSAHPVKTQNHRITYFKRVNFVTVRWVHSTVDTVCLSVSQEIEHHYDLLNHCSFPTWTTWLSPSFCSEFCTHFTSSDRPALNIPSKIAPFACHSVSLLPCLKKLNLLLTTVYAWTVGWVSTLPTVKSWYNFSFDSLYPQLSLWGVSHLGSCSTAVQAYLLEKCDVRGHSSNLCFSGVACVFTVLRYCTWDTCIYYQPPSVTPPMSLMDRGCLIPSVLHV